MKKYNKKYKKPIKEQKKDKNRIYAWILLVFMVFWTICSSLGAIAFFRDDKDDGLLTASAETVSGNGNIYTDSNNFLGFPLQLLGARFGFGGADDFVCEDNLFIWSRPNFTYLGVAHPNDIAAIVPDMHGGLTMVSDSGRILVVPVIITQTYQNYDPSSWLENNGGELSFLGYDVSYDLLDGALGYALALRVMAIFQTGPLGMYTRHYVGCQFTVSDYAILDEENLDVYIKTPFSFSSAYAFIPRVDSSFSPYNHYVEGYFVSADALANYSLGTYISTAFNYDEVYDTGYDEGYDIGYDEGYDEGESDGYENGVSDASAYTFTGLLTSVIDAPIQAFTGLFNFDLLGFNLANFFLSLLTFCLVICVVKLLL